MNDEVPMEVAVTRDMMDEDPTPTSIVARNAQEVVKGETIIRFRGRPMVLVYDGYPHFTPLHKDRFDKVAYPILGGVTRSRMNDVFGFISNTAQDLTHNQHLVLFGLTEAGDDGKAANYVKGAVTSVWDMDELETRSDVPASECVWRSPYAKISSADAPQLRDKDGRIKFIMQLAGGDKGVYDDIMQSLAPMIMKRKPEGVIWWVGDGANGKSTLMDAVYKIFPGQLSSITVKRLIDQRDTPSLNGTLANIVKESSEGRVEDSEIYKAIGTHENFRVHKFHSQDDVEIQGNIHHIFSANMIPTFNDKGYAARRRTFIIPFTQRFDPDPTFEERTFTPELFGSLVMEMCKYANTLKRQGYRYKWSARTLAAKADYDAEASNAEEYAKHIIHEGVVAFDSFGPLKMDYENWCAENGYVPLGITNLRRAMNALGFDRVSARADGAVRKIYRLPNVKDMDLQIIGMSRQGMYTANGWVTEAEEIVEAAKTEKEKDEPKKQTVLRGEW